MRFFPLALLMLLAAARAASAQPLPYVDFQDFLDDLAAIAAVPDADARAQLLDARWAALRAEGRIPFAEGDSVAFLWRGQAQRVAAPGDHSAWSAEAAAMSRVGETDVWMRVLALPEAARVDYLLDVDGAWGLDPANPYRIRHDFDLTHSELRMPAWAPDPTTIRRAGVAQGAFSDDLTLQSARLGYGVDYRVYTPPGYDALAGLPAVYVTDGQNYANDEFGAMRIVLDNLIAERRIAPCVVVFVDPRFQGNPYANRRREQYVGNEAFVGFVADELVPAIDAAYRTRADRDGRVVLGTSLGGLFSAYVGVRRPETFARLGIHSPAFFVSEQSGWGWTGPSIYELVALAPAGLFTVAMTTGTINDLDLGARRMRPVLEAGGHTVTYREVPEGHSWGNWRALLDDVLTALLPATIPTPAAPPPDAQGLRLDATPNPSRGAPTLRFALAERAAVDLACYDGLGRLVARVADGESLAAGAHRRAVRLPGGAFVCRVTAGGRTATRVVSVAR